MITRQTITEAARRYRTSDLNIAREYVQHLFLQALYRLDDADGLLFKGGTALRIVYKSPRFSEDLDFSSFGLTVQRIESLFLETLSELERQGMAITLNERSHQTTGGYFGEAKMRVYEFDISLEINVNLRTGTLLGEYKLVDGEFAPNYGLQMLPELTLTGEKIAAMLSRKKPRDFYDLYFMLRTGLISVEQRGLLREALPVIEATQIDFRQELGVFLPLDSQALIRDFKNVLVSEVRRNAAGN